MCIEFIEAGRHHIEILEGGALAHGAAEEGGLVLRRGVDLDDVTVDLPECPFQKELSDFSRL